MLRGITTFFILILTLSSCTNDPSGFLKRSANNKLFDTKGFQGSKRAPLYNKKYISQAKKNIIKGEYEVDEDDYDNSEEENISRENIEMYKALIKKDLEKNHINNKKPKKSKENFPSLVNSKKFVETEEHFINLELKDELEQTKLILDETRKELENAKCSCATKKSSMSNDLKSKKPSSEQTKSSSEHEHVKSL